MSVVQEIIDTHGQLVNRRANWESLWQEISRRVMPEHDFFQGDEKQPGERRGQAIFDSTAPRALDKLASAFNDMLTPRNQKWHTLKTTDRRLNELREVKLWLEEANEVLFERRYSPRSNFAGQMDATYLGLIGFGTCGMFVDDAYAEGIRYRSVHLADLYIAENAYGVVDRVHRRLQYRADQVMQRFGEEALTPRMQAALRQNSHEYFEVIHCIKPNPDYEPGRLGEAGMRFASYYVAMEDRKLLQQGGYRTFPLPVSRYRTAPRQIYGTSPAIQVLPDIQTLNEMEKTILRVGHKSADPPLLLSSNGFLQQFSLVPGAQNYGALDGRGQPLVREMQTGANFPLTLEMSDRRRELINDTFLVSLFQILVDSPQMTATEVLERAKEKGMLLAPTGGRQQSELLGGVIERELDICEANGWIPPRPDIMQELEAGVAVVYTSPLNQAQRAGEGAAIARTLESVTPLAQIDPSVLEPYNLPAISREFAQINGVPTNLLYSDEELAAKRQAKVEAQQAQALLEAAPVAAKSARDFSQAQALAQTPSNQQLPAIIPQ